LLTSWLAGCRGELYQHPDEALALEYSVRLMINGYSTRGNTSVPCPGISGMCIDSTVAHAMMQSGAGINILRQCLPIRLSDGTSLKYAIGSAQPRPDTGPLHSPMSQCEAWLTNVKSVGLAFNFSAFYRIGGSASGVIMFDVNNFPFDFVILQVGEVGFGSGIGAGIAGVTSEAPLDELTGLGGTISGGYYTYNQYNVAFGTNSCLNSTHSAGLTIGGAWSATITDTDLLYDSRTNEFHGPSLPIIPELVTTTV
jgi:hypothetical protein